MPKVTATSTIEHDGKVYFEGDAFEVSKKQADALRAAGVIETGRAAEAQEAEVVETEVVEEVEEEAPEGDGLDELGFQVLKDRAVADGINISELKSKDALRTAIRAKAANQPQD